MGHDSISMGRGAGLRRHHWTAGETVCANCHSDADPANDTVPWQGPVGENVLPSYYEFPGTDHPNIPSDACNASGTEDFAGGPTGLDNDGDDIYDNLDSDCDAGCTSDTDCADDFFCNGAETCDTGTGECLPGTPVDPDDGVGCTDDLCDETNDVVVNTPNDANCDNGEFCDGAETCDAVNDCQPGTPVDVDDTVGCTDDSCDEANDVVVNTPNDANCDNGEFCDGAETCDAVNDCQPGTPVDVDDTVGCTDDSCDEANDVVVNTPNDANCDNGEFCDGAETCDAVNDCQPGTPVVVDDGVGCTDDSCDEVNDVVVNVPNDAQCDNGEFCDGSETCDAVNDCQAGTPVNVDDGVGCTDDSCDEVNDVVVNAPNDGLCDNGDFCDGSETCDAVNDCQAGTPPCDPATETCDETGDICEPIGCQSDAECDNSEFCDGAETCNVSTGLCEPGTPPVVDDGVGCTVDSCDEVNDVVVNAPDDGFCDNGQFCDGSETCDAVNDCQAGTPPVVDDGVSCTDDSCDEANDVVVNAPNDANCDNGEFCDGSETCDATADCQPGTAPCDPATESCDEVGDICEPIGCQLDAECDNGEFCDGAETCNVSTGLCEPGTPPVVDDGVGCTVDSCDEVNDVVVNAPDDGFCDNGQFCDGSETCDAVNDCQAGTPPVVDDGVSCTDDSCDEANDVVVNAPNDANCDNGEFCDGSETCDATADCQPGTAPCDPATESCDEVGDICEPIGCQLDAECDNGEFCDGAETCNVSTGLCEPGTPPVVDDGVSCTVDSCDEVNDVVVNAPDDGFCDNGQFCDGSETCDAVNDCQAGTPPVVDDGVGCTDDSCDEANDVVVNAPNDGLCDNGAFCDGSETCDATADCQPGTAPCDPATESCDEVGDICEPIGCQLDSECDNGEFCDGAETCNVSTGLCEPGTPPVVDDGVGCTDDSCDEVNDVVVNAPNDGLCDNGAYCDGSETCDAVNDCQAGTPVNVDDGVGCTDDSCDEVNDVVVNTPNDGLCDNGEFCDGSETCDAVNDCQAGTPPCDPATESCDEVGDICEPIGCQLDSECDNGEFCDGAETCNVSTGLCEPGTPPVVDDGVGCTDDSCDEVNDVVVNAPNDGLCDNGAYCDGSETCDAVNDCQAGTPVNVDDGVGCTDDSCDEVNDVVVNTPNDGLCDNGEFCDGSETCDAVNDCQAGTPPCDPATESCDEVGDICEPIGCQLDSECDNGEFCDGAETCNVSTGLCEPGTPPVVDDGVGCTDDSCDEVNDVVVNAPNDGLCDNGAYCDGSETCDAVNDCQAGTPVDVDDGVGCTDDSCDEVNDVVVNAPNDGLCDNGQFCDGSETCDAVNDCQAGTPPVVDDGVGCTDDSCDEANDVVVNAPNDGLCDNGAFCDGSETCDAVNDCLAGTAPCDPSNETCDEVGDICEPIPEIVDLDLVSLRVNKKLSLTRVKPIVLHLTVKNNGAFEGSALATIIGMQNGEDIYNETLVVTDAFGNGRTKYDDTSVPPIPSFEPTDAGVIFWTVTLDDTDPDIDEITASTTVSP